jgi:hypothetical protein
MPVRRRISSFPILCSYEKEVLHKTVRMSI